ncbi:MAG: hypothetical protein PVF77_04345 [Anaerolineae bacterium]|jgi:hypothetical protein
MAELETGRVECYSGHTYAQEPRAIVWHGRRYSVAQVERRWRCPEGPAFWVSAETGERFQLHYHEAARQWAIQLQTPGTNIPDLSESETEPQPQATGPTNVNHHNEDEEVLDLA